jgi:ABC-type phosphate transport system substrate-binding protein
MRRGLVTLALLLVAGIRPAVAVEPFRVIVNAKVAGKAIRRDSLSQIFLGRIDRWGDGRPIAVVDLTTTSPVRESFSRAVVEMSVLSVRAYWTRTISSGHFPPPTRTRDDEVVAFVSTHAGGIGYVSEQATLPETVKVVAVQ